MYNEIYIYGEIGKPSEECPDRITAEDIVRQIGWIDDSQIVLRVNCPGGNYFEALTIFNALKGCGKRVVAMIDGIAASMGSIIVLAADEVVISEFGRVMTHRMRGESKGTAAQLRADADEMERFELTMLEIYSQKTGLTVDECRTKFMNENDTWFSAEEAVAAKLADRKEPIVPAVQASPGLNINDVSAFYQSCAAILKVPNQSKDMDFQKLKAHFNLGDDITEELFLNQVGEWRQKAGQTEQMTAELTGLRQAASQAELNRITGLIDKAVTEKRITASQKEMWVSLFATNAGAAEKALMGIAPAKNLLDISDSDTTERATLAAMTFDQMDKGNKLERCRAVYYDLYEAKFEEKFGKKPSKKE